MERIDINFTNIKYRTKEALKEVAIGKGTKEVSSNKFKYVDIDKQNNK
jgi:hypothetical protein